MHVFRDRLATAVLLIAVPLAPLAAETKAKPPESPDPHQKSYVQHVFGGRGPYMKSAAGAAISQARNSPSEWGAGVAGYARRFASAFGKHVIKSSVQYEVARFRHEEIEYRPSNKQGFAPRLKYALVSTVVTRKTTTGDRTVATGEIAGVVSGGFISRLWQPASLHTVASGFGSAGVSLGTDAGYHVLREFWPEIRHPHLHNATNEEARNSAPVQKK